jgi:hypothetical protein
VIVPDINNGSALIVFAEQSSVDKALAWNGKHLRDQVIRVDSPTSSQLEVLLSSESKNTQSASAMDKLKADLIKLDPSNMLSVLTDCHPTRSSEASIGCSEFVWISKRAHSFHKSTSSPFSRFPSSTPISYNSFIFW